MRLHCSTHSALGELQNGYKNRLANILNASLTILCSSMARRYNSITELNDLWDGDLSASGVLGQQDQQLKDVPDQPLPTSAARKKRSSWNGFELTGNKQQRMSQEREWVEDISINRTCKYGQVSLAGWNTWHKGYMTLHIYRRLL